MFRPGLVDLSPLANVFFLVLGVIGPLLGLVIVLSSTRGRTRQLGAWGAGLLLLVSAAHRPIMDLLRPVDLAVNLMQLVFSLLTVAGIVLLARAVVVGFRAGDASAGNGPGGNGPSAR